MEIRFWRIASASCTDPLQPLAGEKRGYATDRGVAFAQKASTVFLNRLADITYTMRVGSKGIDETLIRHYAGNASGFNDTSLTRAK